MRTPTYSLTVRNAFFCIVLIGIVGCKKSEDAETWVETRDIAIMPYKSNPENGKQYLDVIYENIGSATYSKIKYQLIQRTGNQSDTSEKTIVPEKLFHPKEKHLVPRHIGQAPATFDEVKAGKVWGIVDTKK